MNKKLLIIILALILAKIVNIDSKEAIDFEDILKFEDLNKPSITNNGKWVTYRLDKQRGNSNYIIKSVETNREFMIERGSSLDYSENTQWFVVKLDKDYLDKVNKEKDKSKGNDIVLINTNNEEQSTIENVISFNVTRNGNWLAYQRNYEDKDKSKGKELYLRHLETKSEFKIDNVNDYTFDSLGTNVFYSILKKDLSSLHKRNLNVNFAPESVIESDSSVKYSKLTWSESLSNLYFLKGKIDDKDKVRDNQIKYYSNANNKTQLIADTNFNENWYIPEINSIRVTDDNRYVWLGYKPDNEWYDNDEDTTKITEDNLYDLDKILDNSQLYLWHPNDPEIMTLQRTQWNKIKDKYYYNVYDIDKKEIIYSADKSEENLQYSNSNYTINMDYEPYKRLILYKGWFYDLYSVNINNGKKTLIAKELEDRASLSPNGKYTVYYNKKNWYSYNNETDKQIHLNKGMDTPFYDVMDDHPKEPNAYGIDGWIGEDKFVIVKDEFDLWKFNLSNGTKENITKGFGRKNKTKLNIYRLDYDKKWFNEKETVTISLYGKFNKRKELGLLNLANGEIDVKLKGDYNYNIVKKSKNSDKLIYTKQGFSTYPDLWVTDTLLSNPNQVSNGQKQVDKYIWGTSHLVEYVTDLGDTLQGYYALPDNYKKGKKYPVFVYFYERFSDRKNLFNMPKVNHRPPYSLYLGNEYVMFFPDVKFYDGMPGESSKAALIAGCDKLVEMGIADKNRIVVHGHSWSGYESAWIVTQTDYFAACVSGAPVSNMTSAYSGIRLGSGLARQFQYETQQSRIGGNIIDSLDAYINNSPIFYANQMNTPLMIMFGDVDEAVPWQQGIELYLALRRFDKNCIFLQYENEPHHLKKLHNQLDYSMRMKQFMDYYVYGGEMPVWMKQGFEYKGIYNTGN
jgi:dipeptidyl aminopeptidase/acylaminoacyl peptidase